MNLVNISEVNKAIRMEAGRLFFGSKEVQDPEYAKDGKLAAFYTVRVMEEDGYPRFVCLLNLVGKQFWIGSCKLKIWQDGKQRTLPPVILDYWEYMEQIFDTICDDTVGKDWCIYEEDAFQMEDVALLFCDD